MSDIGNLIYDRRKELGLTLEEVGNAVGVSKSTVKKWENGFISNMRRDKIEKLAKVLEISPIRLLGITTKTYFQPDDPRFVKMIYLYDSLNEIGKEKAVERLEELSLVPNYKQSEEEEYPCQPQEKPR